MWGRLRVLLCACLMAGGVVMVAPPVEGATDPAPFASWSDWVDRLYRDLLKSTPSAVQRTTAAAALAAGTKTPGDLVAEIRVGADHVKNVDPTVRLYRAFFLRIPDKAGLEYWIGRRRSGSWTLVRMADQFAKSTEFTSRYGSLSNRDFVKLIYDNVLQRPYDEGGLSYWTRQLDTKRRTRGAVMANFSESNEYRTDQAAEVTVSVLYIMLLGRAPTPQEFAAAVAALEGGQTVAELANSLLASPGFNGRFATSVSAGYSHNCATLADRTVRCWGVNNHGQLGDGTKTDRSRPVAVSGLTTAVDVVAGNVFSCAVLANGTAKCWGYNVWGRLGDGTTTTRTTPVTVSGLTGAVSIETGTSHACALKSNGTVKCWGYNGYGQLGNGTKTSSSVPVEVAGLTDAVQIDVGDHHSCARRANGTAKCWGYNAYGQVGDGTKTDRTTPVTVPGTNIVSIAASWKNTCTAFGNGTARCWGSNQNGELGNGTRTGSLTPVGVVGLTDAVAVTAHSYHSCALRSTGTARCWGDNQQGEIGDGTVIDRLAPVDVVGLGSIRELSAGHQNTCALQTSGAVWCWGQGADGEIGDGGTVDRPSPTLVLGG